MTAYSPVRISDHALLAQLNQRLSSEDPAFQLALGHLLDEHNFTTVKNLIADATYEMRPPVSPCDLEFVRFNGDVA